MDCPKCQGNGEIEWTSGEEQHHIERTEAAKDRASWPFTCPACGGSGCLEEHA